MSEKEHLSLGKAARNVKEDGGGTTAARIVGPKSSERGQKRCVQHGNDSLSGPPINSKRPKSESGSTLYTSGPGNGPSGSREEGQRTNEERAPSSSMPEPSISGQSADDKGAEGFFEFSEEDQGAVAGDKEAQGGTSGKGSKKQRLVWTAELHSRFSNAVNHLGLKNAVPKTILQLMNVEGMTRENVASHLQKYRIHLKRNCGLPSNARIPSDLIPGTANMYSYAQPRHEQSGATVMPNTQSAAPPATVQVPPATVQQAQGAMAIAGPSTMGASMYGVPVMAMPRPDSGAMPPLGLPGAMMGAHPASRDHASTPMVTQVYSRPPTMGPTAMMASYAPVAYSPAYGYSQMAPMRQPWEMMQGPMVGGAHMGYAAAPHGMMAGAPGMLYQAGYPTATHAQGGAVAMMDSRSAMYMPQGTGVPVVSGVGGVGMYPAAYGRPMGPAGATGGTHSAQVVRSSMEANAAGLMGGGMVDGSMMMQGMMGPQPSSHQMQQMGQMGVPAAIPLGAHGDIRHQSAGNSGMGQQWAEGEADWSKRWPEGSAAWW